MTEGKIEFKEKLLICCLFGILLSGMAGVLLIAFENNFFLLNAFDIIEEILFGSIAGLALLLIIKGFYSDNE